ncbi:MAG: polysaccharide biosynthesis protein [Oscillospiraceae bacterium]|nr:polysaccharide biosynthesis protein [Oscillospiraceae bacterium]
MKRPILKSRYRKVLMYLLDICLILVAYFLAMMLRLEFDMLQFRLVWLDLWLDNLPWMLALFTVSFWLGGLYDVIWRYAGVRDMVRLAVLAAIPTGLITVIDSIRHSGHPVLHRSALMVGCILIICFVGGVRFASRLVLLTQQANRNTEANSTPLMIVGAGSAAAWAVTLCKAKSNFGNPVIMVDDDPAKRNMRVQGVPVRGTLDDIPELARRHRIREIVIAIPTLRGDRLNQVIDLCHSTRCRVRVLSDPQAMEAKGGEQAAFRELNISDFLAREEVKLNTEQISGYLTGKTVLVTGGGGSIGSELCRQIMRFKPEKLLIFDIYENCAYQLEMELRQKYGKDAPVVVLVGSIRDKQRLDEIFSEYRPQVVFHAAAHKHVPLMEISPAEAVKNNVMGTKNLLASAAEHDAERFVQLSTDKAVNPTNVMGCTKRICEMLIQSFAQNTEMRCMAVRFGNVLGSHGSVIPLFESQIRKGGPVTITHPDIVRYFMTIPEAAQLVLQAGALAETGSIYVLDMGEPVRIMDLAKKLIRFYGYEPDVNMPIKIVGLRPGEKLYEELLMDSEQDRMRKTAHDKIFVAPPMDIDLGVFYQQLQLIKTAAEHNDNGVVHILEEMVPTYHPNRIMMEQNENQNK